MAHESNPENQLDNLDTDYNRALEVMTELRRDLMFRLYADGYGPLTIENVDPARRAEPAFEEKLERYGWPTHHDDGLIEETQDYDDLAVFVDQLRQRVVGTGEIRRLSSSHLISTLGERPIGNFTEATTGNGWFGMYPYLHRAHALAPEFFGSLQEVLETVQRRYSFVSDTDHFYAEMQRDENLPIREAVYDAYKLSGRLIKLRDYEIVYLGPHELPAKPNGQPILNADAQLRFGS